MTLDPSPIVAIVMGSESDLETMKGAVSALDQFSISYELQIISAHRTPDEVAEFAKNARSKGLRIIIAGAGGAAHLPGMIAACTELPVIGVPVAIGALQGQDALYSIVQMPKGIPVATVGIGNAFNAGLLAVQILGAGYSDPSQREKTLKGLRTYKEELKTHVMAQQVKLKSSKT